VPAAGWAAGAVVGIVIPGMFAGIALTAGAAGAAAAGWALVVRLAAPSTSTVAAKMAATPTTVSTRFR